MDPVIARKTWRSLEAVHGMIYFTPDALPAYAAVGIAIEANAARVLRS